MRQDKSLLVVTHLSQLLFLITGGVAGIIVPLVLWITQKDDIIDMDKQGRDILNFQISMFVYTLVCVPLIFLFGLGLLGIFAICLTTVIFPIINALKVNKGEQPVYPFTMDIIK